MRKYLDAIGTGMIIFPLLAAVFTIPYMIYCYRKYGSMLFMRVVCVYAFIFYLLCVYCLAILPFPPSNAESTQKAGYNLIPFSYVPELLTREVETEVILSDPISWLRALYSSGWYEPIFNIIMFFPLGVFLRYYFGFSKGKTFLCAFSLSLFLELTQLTGTYGLAPFRYRLCDVNDLIDNTLGGMMGYWCTPLMTALLPTRERLNQLSYQRGERVSYLRRIIALLFDLVLIEVLSWLPAGLGLGRRSSSVLTIILYACLLPYLTSGFTPGQALVRIRVVDADSRGRAHLWQYTARGLLLHLVFLRADILVFLMPMDRVHGMDPALLPFLIILLLMFIAVWHAIHNQPQMFYERWTRTRLISTIVPKAPSPS